MYLNMCDCLYNSDDVDGDEIYELLFKNSQGGLIDKVWPSVVWSLKLSNREPSQTRMDDHPRYCAGC